MKNRKIQLITFVLILSFASGYSQGESGGLKEIKIMQNYLNLPVQNSAPIQFVSIRTKKDTISEFNIRLAKDSIDFWTFIKVDKWKGKKITINTQYTAEYALSKIYDSEDFARLEAVYTEKLRPKVHFTSKVGWINDPNGLVFHDGEYHLFYQHNPYGVNHGNMHWGHAVSEDLIHWEQLDIAIAPHRYRDWAFSGSAVIDKNNTAKFGKDALVAVYTSTGRGECLAYSLDNGRTLKDYEGNPVLKNEGRDPKVFWYAPDQKWVMVVFNNGFQKAENGQNFRNRVFHIHTSNNLIDWEYQSEVPYFWECPELFELPIEGTDKSKWIMYGANAQYIIGDFDGKKFTPETSKNVFVDGPHYASQTFNNTPHGKRIMIAWAAAPIVGMPFNNSMTFPTELKLVQQPNGLRMTATPITAINNLHDKLHRWQDLSITREEKFDTELAYDAMHIIAEFEGSDDLEFGIEVNGYEINYDNKNYLLDDMHLMPINGKVRIEIIVDLTTIEIFGNNGLSYSMRPHVSDKRELKIYASSPNWVKNTHSYLKNLEVYSLKSIWENRK